jgi:polysaccharide export outer membrane protein
MGSASHSRLRFLALLAAALVVASAGGCRSWWGLRPVPAKCVGASPMYVPTELKKVSLPPYVLEPPDILLIDALRVIPKQPFQIQPLDVLQVEAEGTKLDQPIRGLYLVEPGGMLNLGPGYGKVKVGGLSLEEAADAVVKKLKETLTSPQVSVTLNESGGQQQIAGEHLIAPDGTINLGTYGSVYVSGLTVREAKEAIEKHLTQYLEAPLVSVDVYAYNSKVYYVITQGAGLGDDVTRLPVTGNETVIDAVAALGGISQVSSTKMWIARPAPNGNACEQILPVNWNEIAQGASTATNYQLMPGDRLFIAQDRMTNFNTVVGKILNPFERIMGFVSLGASTGNRIVRFGLANTF